MITCLEGSCLGGEANQTHQGQGGERGLHGDESEQEEASSDCLKSTEDANHMSDKRISIVRDATPHSVHGVHALKRGLPLVAAHP
jgi:hypothetical protein